VNYLILIDVWGRLSTPLEIICKTNIALLISDVSDNPNWKIIYQDFDPDIDPKIQHVCNNSNNAIPEHDWANLKLDSKDIVYFAGFHANHCLFEKPLGIDNLLSLHPAQEFFVLSDLTCGLNQHTPVPISDLSIINFNNDYSVKMNMRRAMLLDNLLSIQI